MKLMNSILLRMKVAEQLFPVFKISLHTTAIICPIIFLIYIQGIEGKNCNER